MPAKSKAQQRLMGACAHGANYKSCPKDMTNDQMKDFARTPTKGLPAHVEAGRIYSKRWGKKPK